MKNPIFKTKKPERTQALDELCFQVVLFHNVQVFIQFEYKWWEVWNFHIHDFVIRQLFDVFYKGTD